jgi:hypothetical protein
VVTAASFFICWRAMGAACTRPSLRPLRFEGDEDNDSDVIASRERERLCWKMLDTPSAVMPRFKRGIQ